MSLDLTSEQLLSAAHRAADVYSEIYADLEQRRVDPGVTRAEMRDLFAGTIGEDGVGLEQAIEDFTRYVLPHSMGTPHPLYLGLVNSSPLPAGPLADLLVSALNNNGGAFHQSPAMTTAERLVVQEFARLCGWSSGASGMLVPGGTFANLQGLLLARREHFPQWHTQGPTALSGRPKMYRSDVTHFCLDRAAIVMGIGMEGNVTVPSRDRGIMDVAALESKILADEEAGDLPFAVVATAGTTATGALDPLDEIADVCRRHDLWLHVDACYGGGALLLSPRLKALDAIHRADSIAIDPHKWFFIPMTAGLLLTRHSQVEVDAFDVAPSYIPGDESVDAFRCGLPCSRRSSGLTVWMALRAHGWSVIREAVARNIRLTRELEIGLREAGFRVLDGGQLSIACARWETPGLSDDVLDQRQRKIAQAVVDSGRAWFATVQHQGQTWLRMNMVNLYTQQHHVQTLVELLTTIARTTTSTE